MELIRTYDVKPLIGSQVGTAVLIRELGRGSMAIVFEAFQQSLKRKIAVKILPKSLMTHQAAERFQNEAEAAAVLAHPNIIPIYEIGEMPTFLFMNMQWVQGRDVAHYMRLAQNHVLPSKRILPLSATLGIVVRILEALHYAHGQGIIHRDMKPANILIERHTKRPLISDFGAACYLEDQSVGGALIQGTPLYMAPEQMTGSAVDGRADMYAMGATLFQMLVGELPLKPYVSLAALMKDKRDSKDGIFTRKPSAVNPRLHGSMDRIIEKALAYDPSQRFVSCREFARALLEYRKKWVA